MSAARGQERDTVYVGGGGNDHSGPVFPVLEACYRLPHPKLQGIVGIDLHGARISIVSSYTLGVWPSAHPLDHFLSCCNGHILVASLL